jgi:four helix bundle protein
MYNFEKLDVWKTSKQLAVYIYQLIEKFPQEEKFALCDQLRRACISIPSNIAEGSGRISVREKVHFISIAYGSLMEVYCQLQIAEELRYIHDEDIKGIYNLINKTSLLMTKYRDYLSNQEDKKKA